MKNFKSYKIAALLLSSILLFASCSSTTLIKTNVPNAKVYIDGRPAGRSPFKYKDMKLSGATTDIRIEAEGYKTLNSEFSKDKILNTGALVGGLFFTIPFLWILRYDPVQYFELEPIDSEKERLKRTPGYVPTLADKLRDLKELLDDNIISLEEFEEQKRKLLDGDGN